MAISLKEAKQRGEAAKAAKAKKAAAEKPERKGKNTSTLGGRRRGSGRKVGAATKKTREIADKLAESGEETPLEYMLRVMRQKDDDLDAMEKAGALDAVEKLKLKAVRDERRDWAAEKAAPYIHPRLASIEANVGVSVHESWLEELDD